MKRFRIFFLLLLAGCCPSAEYEIQRESETAVIITGTFNREVLESNDGTKNWFEHYYTDYHVGSSVAAEIGALQQNIRYVFIAGTWCGDSKRELPRMYKIFDAAKIPDKRITLIGVDRSKSDDRGTAEKFLVERVPTFIVLRNEREIGRIVETPGETLEEDLLEILKR
jgi:thiol-disulfide isomerase/thioredoxin